MNHEELLKLLAGNVEAIAFLNNQKQGSDEAIAKATKDEEKITILNKEIETIRSSKDSAVNDFNSMKSSVREVFNKASDAPTGKHDIERYIQELDKGQSNEDVEKFKKDLELKHQSKLEEVQTTLENERKAHLQVEKEVQFKEFMGTLLTKGFRQAEESKSNLEAVVRPIFESQITKVGNTWGVAEQVGESLHVTKKMDEYLEEMVSLPAIQINKETNTQNGANPTSSNNGTPIKTYSSDMERMYAETQKEISK